MSLKIPCEHHVHHEIYSKFFINFEVCRSNSGTKATWNAAVTANHGNMVYSGNAGTGGIGASVAANRSGHTMRLGISGSRGNFTISGGPTFRF